MENSWSAFVGILQTALVFLAQLYGGNISLAIITLSLTLRFALMPLTLRIARRNQETQERIRAIQPELDRLKKRYPNNREKLSQKTLELYQKHGINPLDGKGLLGSLLQAPLFAGMFSAIRQVAAGGGRFLWIPDISQPNIFLAVFAGLLTLISSALAPGSQEQNRTIFILLPAILTIIFAWRLSAGMGLYWAASSAAGIVQSALLRRYRLGK